MSSLASPSAAGSSVAGVEEIRGHFPALSRRHNGFPVAYFDGPGGTQVPRQVAEAMTDYLLNHNANTNWAFPTSEETDHAILEARRALADWIGGSPEEIVFGANMTTLTFHLGRALGREWREGDVVVVTELDHHANSDTWRALAKERGVEIRTVRMRREDGRLDEGDLAGKLTPGVRLLALGAASNALGTINDVPRLTRLAPASSKAPDRLETGTLSHEGMVGAAAAVDFLASLASARLPRRERLRLVSQSLEERGARLLGQLWEGLEAIPGVELYGVPPGGERTPTVAFTLRGIDSGDVARSLAGRGVFVSHGDFYAATVARVLGHERDGSVRAGSAADTPR